ncbi:hypothetical protein [Lacicoccus qingdaonensis]|uniref:Uncharacterized protein n=1 Tax=Lacicoccus qingdaonensis TaxID=576118 RepID=A0A1G9FNA6_9BACL|nr:hypothetical protein [Salinicoccus qingdaonensis]SDK89663.1 hypothetical protein SAMN05216216_11318 [Salinicoccus qingdaonensis]
MGLFNLRQFFQSDQPIEDKEEQPYTCLSIDQGENETPTIDDVFHALELLHEGQTDFVTLAHFNYDLEIDVIQAIGSMDKFILEALPSETSDDKGKIFYKDYLDRYSLEYYFQDFFESQRVAGVENFEER